MTKSTQTKMKVKLSAMSEDDRIRALTALLQAQPDILKREPKLIQLLELDDPTEGNVTSLAKRQAERLKNELSQNKRRTQDLIENAKVFDVINNKIYDLIYDLTACLTIDELFDCIAVRSPDLFEVDFVELRGTMNLNQAENLNRFFNPDYSNNLDYQHVMARLAQGKCLCSDRFPVSVLQFFFGEHFDEAKSAAFIPMIGIENDPKQTFGILAFASKDQNKFSSGLRGTIHLERIGKITALSIERITKQMLSA